MKKGFLGKLLIKLSCVVLALMCGFACCACQQNELYGDWQRDEKYHWRYNSKGEIVDKAIHNFLWWQCTLCGYTIEPPEPEPPPELPEDPDPPVQEEEPEDDEPTYDEPLPEDPWVEDPEDPWDDPTDDPPEEDSPIEEPSEDDPEEDPPVEEPPQEEPSEEEPPEEDPPAEEPPQEEPPKEEPKPEQKPENKPSTPSTPSTPTKPTKPVDPNYPNESDWSDWQEAPIGGGDSSGQGGTQGGEGTGGDGGSAGGGTVPVQPNPEAQQHLIFTPIYNGNDKVTVVAYSVKADMDHNKNKYIEIPDTHQGPETTEPKPVTVIDKQGFQNLTTLETIRLSSNLTEIGYEAFAGSTLQEIYIPDSVTFIDMRAFASCKKLNKVRLPNNENYTKVEYECFHACTSLGRIVIPNQVTYITTRAFEYAKLQSLVIGTGLKNIGHQAFNESSIKQGILIYDLEKWCNIKIDSQISSPLYWGHRFFLWKDGKAEEIKDLVIPDSITELGRFQFGGCTSIRTVDMSKVTNVLDEVFIHCTNIEKVILPDTLPEFTANLFYDCRSLEEMVIPEGITQIPYCCFYHNESLKKLTIPKSVVHFGSLSIDGCKSLKEIIYEGTKEDWEKITNRDGWMWYNGTGDFVIKCENGEIAKADDQKRFPNPFEQAQKELEEKYGTGYLTAGRREEYAD